MATKNQDSGQLELKAEARSETSLPAASVPSEGDSREGVANGTAEVVVTRSNRKADRQEFFLPVTGFVWLLPEEVAVVDHPAFQRLGRIYQLGQSYFVFRGATHKRLEHVLGALYVVQRMISAVQTNSEKLQGSQHWAPPLSEAEASFVRLGTLLHDIGHMAAGHTVEDELELVSKHDEDRRLELVLNGDMWRNQDGQNLGELIDAQYRQCVPEELRKKDITASTIVRLLVRKQPKANDTYSAAQELISRASCIRLQICRDMIGNTICADLLDYIHRDWYHVGKPRPFDDRLLQYMEIRRGHDGRGSLQPHAADNFVISLGRRPKIRTDAVSHILDLLEWRYSLAETVLFHRTKLAAAAMLDRALFELWGQDGAEDDIVSFLLPLSDEEMLSRCREKAETLRRERKLERRDAAETAAGLLSALENRQLFTHLSTRFAGDLPGDQVVKIKETYGRNPKDRKAASANRNSALRVLEQDFVLPRGSLAMYCPAGMNRKIAEVRIAVNDEIERFNEYEIKHDRPLAGGHLDAQLRRFDRLWRVHFFIDKRVKRSIGERAMFLQQAVEKLALGNLFDDETGEQVSLSFAKTLSQVSGPWEGHRVSTTPLAARSGVSVAPSRYPLGAPSVRAFLYK